MRLGVLLLVLSLSDCLPPIKWKAELPKIVEVRYQAIDGRRMSILCVHETRADTPPVTYECDTGERR